MTPMKLYLPDTTGLMNSQRLADAQDPHRQSHKTEKGKWTLDLIPANTLSATENHWQRKTSFLSWSVTGYINIRKGRKAADTEIVANTK